METWATFSIIDHRKPIYRQALALFDRIVVPVPPKPIGNQTQEELDQLSAEIAYLKEAKAAEPYEWESAAFEEWRQPFLAESLAVSFNRDAFLDTRLMLSQQFCSQDVQAIPVYGGEHQFADSRKALMQVEEALTIEIMQRLPVPEYDTPLENLVKLRETPAFRTALNDLLEWKRDKAPAIMLAEDRKSAMAAAMRDFDKLTKAYAEAMESEGYRKMGSVGSIFFILIREPLWALGLSGAFVITRFIRSLLFGIGATDAVTFTLVPTLLVLTALLASFIPARRAAKVDPMIALRYE